MLCQNCKKNESSFSYMQVVNGVVTKISICKECAKEKNINQIDININIPFSVKDLFASIIDANKIDKSKSENLEEKKEKTCPKCCSTYSRFQSMGKLGCETCYDTFKDELSPLIRRVQIRGEHIGKIPEYAEETLKIKREITQLKTDMKHAIQAEEFEIAAKLRDKIKLLEKEV